MDILTADNSSIAPFIKRLNVPDARSHKGQNGRALIIGGSSLFHASAIWAAEVASHFVDIVHFSSTEENNQIFFEIKKKFHNGILVSRSAIPDYIREDDAILLGPGMMRSERSRKSEVRSPKSEIKNIDYSEILKIENEPEFTRQITKFLIQNYPEKRFVFDAGALQMMNCEWLKDLKTPALITPHQLEFERLFSINITDQELDEKVETVKKTAEKFRTVILLKAVDDIISDGRETYVVHGGNQGLTKGGTGDILAGLCTALYTKNDALNSAVLSSFILKKTADTLSSVKGYWYNNDDLIRSIPETAASLHSEFKNL